MYVCEITSLSTATKTSIDSWWLMDKYPTGSWRPGSTQTATFIFDRFLPDDDDNGGGHHHQAVFRSSSPLDRRGAAILFSALRDQELLRHVVKKPRHQVRIAGLVDELALPDLRLVPRECELVLDWRRLFLGFFAKGDGGSSGIGIGGDDWVSDEIRKGFAKGGSSCNDDDDNGLGGWILEARGATTAGWSAGVASDS